MRVSLWLIARPHIEYHGEVEPDTRGRGARRATPPAAGTFRPGLPSDSQDVIRLFAIAARAICADPKAIDIVTACLLAIAGRLVPPERQAAEECARMWRLFARVAQLPKETLRLEAARAFCRDLDSLGQKLDLPPLSEWNELPQGIDDPGFAGLELEGPAAPAISGGAPKPEPLPLGDVRASARALADSAKEGVVVAEEAARLLAALAAEDRQKLFQQMIGRGELSRSDANLLIRHLLKGSEVGAEDVMLREVLERLGQFLVTPP